MKKTNMAQTDKQRELRIVFMGTPEFAVISLDHLLRTEHNVVGVITSPDKPSGRGQKLHESAVKKYAQEKKLPVLQPKNLKDEHFLKALKNLNGNLQIIVAFRMLPKAVWEVPKYGTFNLHASLLPEYRGAAPINWAIINGETETGVTTFFIDEKIDTGEIILQDRIEITEKETAGELHDKLAVVGADLVLKTVNQIKKGTLVTTKQREAPELKQAPKIFRETCEIDWSNPIDVIYNHIRGLSPYPTAWTTLHNDKEMMVIKIYGCVRERVHHDLPTGKIIVDQKTMKVAVDNGFIRLLQIQAPGKRKMDISDFLNGNEVSKNAYVR
ncbi:methionyl-tRNA formyltransferase [Allomuricauda sp. SCSIO 65647]|uniref:methionyl-tRNA formyltransferase n=1 Tax=Allomuricauda sp. SCSIO 65647 TaxID=2908843 RepID=UPI001F009705|nr:methionyl-tRNA formyltransferase [Muricauda sp. SCSIO 65647]UJH67089.1 methionyl-tRNA formyltransferase [Muricauda sp. SCSIO 65647]